MMLLDANIPAIFLNLRNKNKEVIENIIFYTESSSSQNNHFVVGVVTIQTPQSCVSKKKQFFRLQIILR